MNSMIIVAAGRGIRFGAGKNKLLESIGGLPLIGYTLRGVKESRLLDELILVTEPEERSTFRQIIADADIAIPVRFADGGLTRMDSVAKGLAALSPESDIVLIHDGARPFVDGEAIDRMVEELQKGTPAAIYVIPCTDTIKETENGFITGTPDRSKLCRAQTPQGAQTALFRHCMEKVCQQHWEVTDDASLCERCGIPVKCLEGKEDYFKVTVPMDKERVLHALGRDTPPFRVGQGYDIHPFSTERPLVLGGVRISETGGLAGHSDADVLIHAIMDALLGAAGLRDIGSYFPDTDERYLNVSSVVLLQKVKNLIANEGYAIGNIDSTVIAETPKLSPYIDSMKETLAGALQVDPGQIAIKATTNESLGAIGRREGIAALASVLLYQRR